MKRFGLLLAFFLLASQSALAMNASADFVFGLNDAAWPVEMQGRFGVGAITIEIVHVQHGYYADGAHVAASALEVIGSSSLGPITLGVGFRDWGEIHRAEGEATRNISALEPIAFVGLPIRRGIAFFEARTAIGESGTAWLATTGVDYSGLQFLVGYRHWPMEGWYSGPVFSVGVTF